MGASDYIVGNAPGAASYSPPDISRLLMLGIAALPESYFKGTQNARTLAMQQPASTNPDELLQQVAQRGGVQSMQS
jgi:hypothetical protein